MAKSRVVIAALMVCMHAVVADRNTQTVEIMDKHMKATKAHHKKGHHEKMQPHQASQSEGDHSDVFNEAHDVLVAELTLKQQALRDWLSENDVLQKQRDTEKKSRELSDYMGENADAWWKHAVSWIKRQWMNFFYDHQKLLEAEVASLTRELAAMRTEKARLEREVEQLTQAKEDHKDDARGILDSLNAQVENLDSEIENYKRDMADAQTAHASLKRKQVAADAAAVSISTELIKQLEAAIHEKRVLYYSLTATCSQMEKGKSDKIGRDGITSDEESTGIKSLQEEQDNGLKKHRVKDDSGLEWHQGGGGNLQSITANLLEMQKLAHKVNGSEGAMDICHRCSGDNRACGDVCIKKDKKCHSLPGCACDDSAGHELHQQFAQAKAALQGTIQFHTSTINMNNDLLRQNQKVIEQMETDKAKALKAYAAKMQSLVALKGKLEQEVTAAQAEKEKTEQDLASATEANTAAVTKLEGELGAALGELQKSQTKEKLSKTALIAAQEAKMRELLDNHATTVADWEAKIMNAETEKARVQKEAAELSKAIASASY